MAWVVWSGIGAFLVVLLTISWLFDRSARRRGATPLSGAVMGGDRRQRRVGIESRESGLFTGGATPRTMDAARDSREGRTDR